MTDEPLPPDLDVNLPLPDGLRVTTERPYRILLVSDLAGSADGTLAGPLTERVVDVDADSFDELLAAARPAVRFKLADPLLPGNVLTELELRFDSLKAFAPAALAEQIPATRLLHAARAQVVARLCGKLSSAQLTDQLQHLAAGKPGLAWLPDSIRWTPAASPPPSEAAVNDLLGQFDLGGEPSAPSAPPPKSPIGAVVSAVAAGGGPTLPAEESAALRRTLTEFDRRVTTWLNVVLHAPAVQRLEAAWRALAFLIAHIDFRKHVRLAVLHTPRAALTERFVALLIDPVFDAGADAPDLIVVDAAFTNTPADIETLDELAQHGASLPAAVLAGVSADFLGVKHAWQVPTLPAFVALFDQWQYAKWKTLRGQPYARALGVLFGRCLLRTPWNVPRAADLGWTYTEECLGENDFVWTTAPLAAACTVAHSQATTGWPTGIVGRVEGFAIGLGGKKGEKQYGPADTQMPLEKAQELMAGGLNAAIGLRDQTDVIVCNGFTAARPDRTEGFAMLEVSLPYQLFAGRLSSLLLDLKAHLAGQPRDTLVPFVLAHVRDWMTMEGVAPDEQQVAVQARPVEDAPGAIQLAVTVTPPPRILPGAVPVVVGYRLS